mmetsp:Transcript_119595/g.238229  ORF Transcript_119595/g.238229 Transcript_119595/m.238229 type:complete len:531 (-) Transcript_119595:32-1624(-)
MAHSATPLRCWPRHVYNHAGLSLNVDPSSNQVQHEEREPLQCNPTTRFTKRAAMIAGMASIALMFTGVIVAVLVASRPWIRHVRTTSLKTEDKSLAFPYRTDAAPGFLLVSQDSKTHVSGSLPQQSSYVGDEAGALASTYDGVPWWANQSEAEQAEASVDDTSDSGFEEGAGDLQPMGQDLQPLSESAAPPPDLKLPQGDVLPCGTFIDQIDYPGNDLGPPFHISSAEKCCQTCALKLDCVAWTMVKVNRLCFLKGGHPRGALTAVFNADTTSGMPTQVGRSIPTITRKAGQSIFCFSLMLPWGYEKGLLQMQYRTGASIFGCDEYAVYSNQKIQVAEGVITRIVDSNLKCKMGGEFKTCLNTPIFLKVWDRILKDNRPRLHDWSVKVDPDAVFFPARLRGVLQNHQETPQGIYLNNCRLGLHGPLEVFSRNAVNAWSYGRNACVKHFRMVCSGDCQWGEDMFIDQCLWKVLKISRVLEPALLVEDHCEPPLGWQDCQDPGKVAFHPFKDRDGYRECMNNAEAPLSGMYK